MKRESQQRNEEPLPQCNRHQRAGANRVLNLWNSNGKPECQQTLMTYCPQTPLLLFTRQN